MKYMGSKARHANAILSVIKERFPATKVIAEPFCGGANFTYAAKKQGFEVYPSDTHADVISYLQALSNGWIPPKSITEAEYRNLRFAECSPLRGYAGFALSYGGKWFGGWRRDSLEKRDYGRESWNAAMKEQGVLKGMNFKCQSYEALTQFGDVVYADPPYSQTTSYLTPFDSAKFWVWAEACPVPCFVSEYRAANADWKPVWKKSVANSLAKDTGKTLGVETLFLHKRWYKELAPIF